MTIRPCPPEDADAGKPVCLYTRDGKHLLGRHRDRHNARLQEAAIKARTNPSDELPSIYVYGREEVGELFERGNTDHIAAMISIGDIDQGDPWFLEEACEQGIEVLRLEFDDVLEGEENAPDEEDARLIVEFLREVLPKIKEEGGVLLIHCEVGISRSGASAALAWMIELPEASPEEIAALLVKDRPQIYPNEFLLEMGASLIGKGVEFASTILGKIDNIGGAETLIDPQHALRRRVS